MAIRADKKPLARRDRARVREICEELATLRLNAGSAIPTLLPAMRTLLEADSLLVASPIERVTGWDLERFEQDGFACSAAFASRMLAFFESAPRRYAWYDATRPEPAQRNRVIDALDIIPRAEYEASRIHAEVMQPCDLHRHHQPRVLVCDGRSLLAWFGAFHPVPFDERQNRILGAFVPALRRRLRSERQLRTIPTMRAMLQHVLDQLGAPAFVIDAKGRTLEASRSGRALFDLRPRETAAALRRAAAGSAAEAGFELTAISDAGGRAWLAVARTDPDDRQLASAIASACAHWRLTPRQRSVLEWVVRGASNTTIAAQLGVGVRAVELHITAMFDRAGVDNRASLVGAVLRRELRS